MSDKKEPAPEVAHVAIRRQPDTHMYLRSAVAEGTLPDGREYDLGVAGALLVLCVHDGGPTFTISAREMVENLLLAKML